MKTALVANATDASAVSKNNDRIKKYQEEIGRAQRRIQELERNVQLRNESIRKSARTAKDHRNRTLKKLNTLQNLLDEGGRIMKTFKAKITDQKAELSRNGTLLVTEYAKNEKLESRILKRDRKIRRLQMTLKSFVLAGVLAASVPFFMSRNAMAYPTVKSRGNASTKKLIAQIQNTPTPVVQDARQRAAHQRAQNQRTAHQRAAYQRSAYQRTQNQRAARHRERYGKCHVRSEHCSRRWPRSSRARDQVHDFETTPSRAKHSSRTNKRARSDKKRDDGVE